MEFGCRVVAPSSASRRLSTAQRAAPQTLQQDSGAPDAELVLPPACSRAPAGGCSLMTTRCRACR